MSVDAKVKKRKSGDEITATTIKKVRTFKSGAPPVALKSALKKTKVQSKPIEEPALSKAIKKTTKKPKTDAKPAVVKSDGKVTKKKVPELQTASDEDSDAGGVELSADQTAALIAGFSSDESDNDDDGDKGLDISTLPAAPTSEALQKRIHAAVADDPESTPGVVYIARIPHGFYEPQMRAYFSQFGAITNLRLARNRRTGKSQHHAFVEFAAAAVADIVAKTMDKYLLFGHILQARRVPREQVKENMWIQGKTPGRPAPRNKIERGALRRGMVREGWEKRVQKEEARRLAKAEQLKELGYEFDMPAVKAVSDVPVKLPAIEQAEVKDRNGDGPTPPKGNDGEAVQVETTVQTEPGQVTVMQKKVSKKRKGSSSDTVSRSTKKTVKA